jgi:hypothetical protein
MQSCGLSITLFQLKLKVVELIEVRAIPFQDGVLRNFGGIGLRKNI